MSFKTGARPSLASPYDRGPVPVAVEDASESAWAEYDSCWEQLDLQVSSRPAPSTAARGAVLRAADRDLGSDLG